VASIGIPNLLNQGEIPALLRVQENDPFINTCGEIPTHTTNQDISRSSIKVFPNPFFDFITIQSEEIIQQIDVFDFSGKHMISKTFNNNSIDLHLNEFAAGMYTLKIQAKHSNTSSIRRIIKFYTE